MVSSRRLALGTALLAAILAVAWLGAAAAGATPPVSAPVYVVESEIDDTTLAARAAGQRHAIASITKLMTALVVRDRAALDEVVVVPAAAARIGESSARLRPGERLTVRDLLVATLVPSANDAALALALHVGQGSERRFVALMNAKARALGLRGTRFANAHGLDQPGHFSTARDVVELLRVALRDPFLRTWAGRERAEIAGGRRLETTDDLLGRLPALVGAKTGQTDDAGWSQVASARAGGVTVYAAVLGGATREARNADLERLLRWGLARYRPARVVDAERVYARADPGWGLPAVGLVPLGSVTRPASVARPLVERAVVPQVLRLPVRRGDRLGEVRVYDGDRLVASAPLVADRSVDDPGLLAKARFTLRRTAHHLTGLVS
jgi:D-alanyl-D-alanine carboxypeptidase (penicillin-binding protein 5/6)